MTVRLYFQEPYLRDFDARVVERLEWEGRPAIILDRSGFYPTGGGQPHDTGSIEGVPVIEVLERESDGAVVHILAEWVMAEQVTGHVNRQRRLDLTHQHTGQHILSAAFVELLGANTVGFHLSDEYATIDLDRAPLSTEDLTAVEERANGIVIDNHQVVTRFVPREEAAELPLRKPLTHEGPARIVEIPGFDCSACGGTHVRTTGELGLIKIVRTERRGAETRVEFLCGGRALRDYRFKNALVMDLSRQFTVGHWELAGMVHRMAEELKDTRRDLRRTRDALLDAEATALWHQAQIAGGVRVVQGHYADREADDLKHLALRLVDHPQTVALLGSGKTLGAKGHFTFARSDDVDLHMGILVRHACQSIGGGGGGRPEFAQGGGPNGERVSQALDEAFRILTDSLPYHGN